MTGSDQVFRKSISFQEHSARRGKHNDVHQKESGRSQPVDQQTNQRFSRSSVYRRVRVESTWIASVFKAFCHHGPISHLFGDLGGSKQDTCPPWEFCVYFHDISVVCFLERVAPIHKLLDKYSDFSEIKLMFSIAKNRIDSFGLNKFDWDLSPLR